MELYNQIKKYRGIAKLSQEELAERIYVTRQTISNWETGKNYPDIHSLLLMSQLFHISLDELIKGDLKIMEEEIKAVDIQKFHHQGKVLLFLFLLILVTAAPLFYYLEYYGMAIYAGLVVFTLWYATKVERFKKENNIQTYKEIVAFTKGERLDEIAKHQEVGKRPYQHFLLAAGAAVLGFVITIIVLKLFEIFS